MTSLAGRTMFISGGSRGIGLAIALRAARDGANIAIAAKTVEPHPKLEGTIHTAAAAIEAAGGKALPIACDIREEAQVKAAIEATVERFGGLDIVVNNASAISLTGTEATEMKRFDLMHQVNTRGTFLVSKLAIPHLAKSAEPAHPDAVAAARPDAALVCAAPRLFDRQVRHVAVRAGAGGRAASARHRRQRAVAAHDDRHRRHRQYRRRRRDDAAEPQAGDHGGRRSSRLHDAGARTHRPVPDRRYASSSRAGSPTSIATGSIRAVDLQPDFFVPADSVPPQSLAAVKPTS